MTVTKLEVIIIRIPEQFSLHFYEFSTILYRIFMSSDSGFTDKSLGSFISPQIYPWPDYGETEEEEVAGFRRAC